MRNVNCIALSGIDSTSENGSQLDSNQWVSASFHAHFGDATAAGTLLIQASNDINNDRYQASDFVVSNWVAIPGATAAIAAGAPALILIPVCSFRWMRAVYTSSSGGSTTIVVNVNALGV